MGAEYLSYVKSIAAFAPTFYGYIIFVLASVTGHGSTGGDAVKDATMASKMVVVVPLGKDPTTVVTGSMNQEVFFQNSFKFSIHLIQPIEFQMK